MMAKSNPLKRNKTELQQQPVGMADYVRGLIPEDAKIDFIFRTDVDGNGVDEGLIGYSVLDSEGHLVSHVLLIRPGANGYTHQRILATVLDPDSLYDAKDGLYGATDSACLADTNGNGLPELILGLAAGNGHYLKVHVIRLADEKPMLVWNSEDGAYHGVLDVLDTDGDGASEIIVEGSTWCGEQILSLAEADPHVRLSTRYKWNGQTYVPTPHKVKHPENESYNVAVAFLGALWKKDYETAYNVTRLPVFLGLKGLDDSSLATFTQHVEEQIVPELQRNLEKGLLQPQDVHAGFCLFAGVKDLIQVSLETEQGQPKVASVQFIPF